MSINGGLRRRLLWERQDSNLRCVHICCAFVLSATLPWWRAGLPPVKQTLSKMTQNIFVRPVYVSFIPIVVCIISQLSCSVTPSAGGVLPGVESCAAALGAEDWIRVFVHGFIVFEPLFVFPKGSRRRRRIRRIRSGRSLVP